MARLKGILQIEGTLDDLSFYKTQDGIVVRRKWGPDKKRMQQDAAFEAARKHGREFGAAARHSSLLRGALRGFVRDSSDNRLTGRVNKLMLELMKLDDSAEKGERRLHVGIQHTDAAQLVAGFEFNSACPLKDHLLHLPEFVKKRGVLYAAGSLNKKDLLYPKGATHAGLQVAWLRLDFESRRFQLKESTTQFVDRKAAKTDVRLKTTPTMQGNGVDFFILKLVFCKKTGDNIIPLGKDFSACAFVKLD